MPCVDESIFVFRGVFVFAWVLGSTSLVQRDQIGEKITLWQKFKIFGLALRV